jgi:hypothetical protein
MLRVMTTCWRSFYSGTLLLSAFLLVAAKGSQKTVLNLKPIVCFLKFSLHFSSPDNGNFTDFMVATFYFEELKKTN